MGITVRVEPPISWRLDELKDDDLARAVRDGDDDAFELLFRRHQPAVLAFCRHMLGRTDEAQDAAQHTFLAAYRALRGATPLMAVRPWLFTVARNRCISMLRARRDDPVGDAAEEPATDGLAFEVQQRAELRALLGDLAALPDDQRGALLLAELADFSHVEIARVLGVRRTKVKALVFQAREALMAAKDARDTPCAAVREELATARGAALRRSRLRRHLHECAGCREFRDRMRDQRRALGLLLPVAPTVLRDTPLLRALETSGTASGGAGVAAATGFKAVAAKLGIGAALAGGVAGGTVAVTPIAADPQPPVAASADTPWSAYSLGAARSGAGDPGTAPAGALWTGGAVRVAGWTGGDGGALADRVGAPDAGSLRWHARGAGGREGAQPATRDEAGAGGPAGGAGQAGEPEAAERGRGGPRGDHSRGGERGAGAERGRSDRGADRRNPGRGAEHRNSGRGAERREVGGHAAGQSDRASRAERSSPRHARKAEPHGAETVGRSRAADRRDARQTGSHTVTETSGTAAPAPAEPAAPPATETSTASRRAPSDTSTTAPAVEAPAPDTTTTAPPPARINPRDQRHQTLPVAPS